MVSFECEYLTNKGGNKKSTPLGHSKIGWAFHRCILLFWIYNTHSIMLTRSDYISVGYQWKALLKPHLMVQHSLFSDTCITRNVSGLANFFINDVICGGRHDKRNCNCRLVNRTKCKK
uniref:Uncharacterized protein n=1 Tax=Romanomermis culicivorax TaxID=13658 RepID=A0A915ISZ3_ROMCU